MRFKLLLFLALASSCFNTPIPEGYKSISIKEALSDPQILSLIEEGLKIIVEDSTEIKSIVRRGGNYSLFQINSVYQKVDNEYYNYKFSCVFQNLLSNSILANFEVKYNPLEMTSSSTFYSFEIIDKIEEVILELYEPVDFSAIETRNEIEKVANFGLQQIVKQASWKGKIFANYPVYEVTNITSVFKQNSGQGIFYKCAINFTANPSKNREKKFSEASFIVYYQPYQEKYYLLEFVVPSETVYNVVDSEIETSEIILKDIEDPFVSIDTKQAKYKSIAQECPYYAIQQFRTMGFYNERNFRFGMVKNVNKLEAKIAGNGVFYKYDCEMVGEGNGTFNASFIVYNVVTLDNKKSLVAYSIKEIPTSSGPRSYSSPYNPFTNIEDNTEKDAETPVLEEIRPSIGIIENRLIEELEQNIIPEN